MHPEVVRDQPGSCPKCGMFLEDVKGEGEPEGQPVSPDGLIMEWIDVPFGPFFPGLPGGLGLDMSLDGDSVAKVNAHSLVGMGEVLANGSMVPEKFTERLSSMSPLSPIAYRQLACLALENAAKQ